MSQVSAACGPGDGLAWMDLLPTDRTAAMRAFVAEWYPAPKLHAVRPKVSGVPAALAELYAIAAGRPEVLGTQNEVYAPDQLHTDPHEGLLVFAAENQANFSWLIDPTEEDPVVWMAPPHGVPVAEREPLSGFLVQFCLFEALMSAPLYAGCSTTPPEQARQVTAGLREVPLAPWLWPADPTRFYVAPDLVLYAGSYSDHVEILAGARCPAALAPLAAVDVPWDLFDE